MQTNRTILTLFKGPADEALCAPLLAEIPGIIRIMAGDNLAVSLENLKKIGIEPCLAILSRRLYPEEKPDLATMLKKLFPSLEFLLLSSTTDPFPPLFSLARDGVRHLVINPAAQGGEEGETKGRFTVAVKKLVEGSSWKMVDYVRADAYIHEFVVSSSAQKEELIARVEAVIRGDAPDIDLLRQRGALLADEMLENALYGAPRGEDGGKLYQKGEERAIQPRERIVFRFAFDGETLAMEVADGWGSLSPDIVMEYLAKNQANTALSDETGGRGLFIIWRFLDYFHVSISPGRQTVVGGHLKASSPLDPEAPRGFHISALC